MIDQRQTQRVVFLGDACDDWRISDDEALLELGFFRAWVNEQRENGLQVDVLVGNHEMPYLMGTTGAGTRDFIRAEVKKSILELKPTFATLMGGFLCTHAGVTSRWRDAYAEEAKTADELCETLNNYLTDHDMWGRLATAGRARGGVELPGPLWADRSELLICPAHGLKQIVWHTPVRCATNSSTNEELWFCDTLSVTRSGTAQGNTDVLVVEEGSNTNDARVMTKPLFAADEWQQLMFKRMGTNPEEAQAKALVEAIIQRATSA